MSSSSLSSAAAENSKQPSAEHTNSLSALEARLSSIAPRPRAQTHVPTSSRGLSISAQASTTGSTDVSPTRLSPLASSEDPSSAFRAPLKFPSQVARARPQRTGSSPTLTDAAGGSEPGPLMDVDDRGQSSSPLSHTENGSGSMPGSFRVSSRAPRTQREGQYIALLRNRIQALEEQVKSQNDTIERLTRERKSQAQELQSLLRATMARQARAAKTVSSAANAESGSIPNSPDRRQQLEPLKQASIGVNDDAAEAVDSMDRLNALSAQIKAAVSAEVLAEGDLYTAAGNHAQCLRTVSELDGPTPRRLERELRMLTDELASKAEAKDLAHTRLNMLLQYLNDKVNEARTAFASIVKRTNDMLAFLHGIGDDKWSGTLSPSHRARLSEARPISPIFDVADDTDSDHASESVS